MAGMSVGGLVSGLDTASLINQLMTLEGAQQNSLKTRLTETERAATQYRSVNSKFDALRTLAQSFTKPEIWSPTKATSSSTGVIVATTSAAQPGALTFEVKQTAAAHSVLSAETWGSTGESYGLTDPIGVYKGGVSVGSIDVVAAGTGAPTLADAVAAINKSPYKLTAAAVQTSPGVYQLQVNAKDSGEAGRFTLGESATSAEFGTTTVGRNARLRVGEDLPYDVYSSSNQFDGLLPGVALTVTKPEPRVTVEIAADPEAVAAKVQELVDAANAAIAEIKKVTDPKGLSVTAALKGDYQLAKLTGQILNAVSSLVGTTPDGLPGGSPGLAGVELTRTGTIDFRKDKFLKALAEDPTKVQRLMAGVPGDYGPDAKKGTVDDVTPDTPGVAMRLFDLADDVTDRVTGSLVLLARGRDELADDLKDRIGAWDIRLAMRKETLTRQFTALEVALGRMNQQSSWLSGQLASLPSSS